jgi:site-specific DNA-cytosine methylase
VLYDLFVMGFYYARKCQIIIFHDHLNIPSVIRDVLGNELNHCMTYLITDGQKSAPQHRERIIMVGSCRQAGCGLHSL